MAHIVIINPRFEVSYWGLEHALPLFGAKANLPVACLPLLAALTPSAHTVTLMDENVEPIDYDLCARADIVGLTGMIIQRFRMTEILSELKARGCFTVVGGPWGGGGPVFRAGMGRGAPVPPLRAGGQDRHEHRAGPPVRSGQDG